MSHDGKRELIVMLIWADTSTAIENSLRVRRSGAPGRGSALLVGSGRGSGPAR
jgi:hypothetical protein